MKRLKLFLFTLLALVLVACGSSSDDNKQESSDQTSGEFTLYTSQPEEDINQLVEAFNKDFPEIKVNIFRSGTEEVISKVKAEKEAGDVLADALLVSDSFTFESLAEDDLLETYESSELKNIPDEYVDDEHLYTGTKLIVTGIAVNTELADPKKVKGFASMTEEEFKGKTMIPSPLYSGAASLNLSILTQQDNIGWKYYEDLHANDVFVGEGNGTVRDALLNNQQGMGMLVDYMAIRAKNDGASIEFVYPEEGALYVTEPVGIIKDAKHAKLAQHFVDFILSEKGQQVTADMGYTPVREGIKAPKGMRSVEEIKPINFDEKKVMENREADKEKFAEIFGQ